MSYTKGKWTVPNWTRRDGDNRCWVMRDKTSICRCFGKPKTAEANAKELVRRWNAFEKDGLVDELRKVCEGLVHRGSCIIQSHQCVEHKGGDCCDLAYMLDAIQKGKAAIAKVS